MRSFSRCRCGLAALCAAVRRARVDLAGRGTGAAPFAFGARPVRRRPAPRHRHRRGSSAVGARTGRRDGLVRRLRARRRQAVTIETADGYAVTLLQLGSIERRARRRSSRKAHRRRRRSARAATRARRAAVRPPRRPRRRPIRTDTSTRSRLLPRAAARAARRRPSPRRAARWPLPPPPSPPRPRRRRPQPPSLPASAPVDATPPPTLSAHGSPRRAPLRPACAGRTSPRDRCRP